MLVSYALGDPGSFDGVYQLVQLDVRNGTRRTLIAVTGRSIVDAVAIYSRQAAAVFAPDPNNFTVEAGAHDAAMRNVDLPMIASLMFENRRGPRKLEQSARWLGILESLPAPAELVSFDMADPAFVTSDEYGKMWIKRRRIGVASTYDDGSIAFRIPGGVPFVQELISAKDQPAYATQVEEAQLYPGERAKGSFRRSLFDANCGGCHGAVSGRETEVHLRPDVITEASRATAITGSMSDLYRAPADRGPAFGK